MIGSTLSSWALLIWRELDSRGLDANALFAEVGLNPGMLKDAVARYPADKMHHLWRLAQQQTDDSFGIAAGNRWTPTTFHALGFAWLASASLGDALYRFSRYGQIVSDGLTYTLKAEGLSYRFTISAHQNSALGAGPSVSSDAGIAALMKMTRLLMGEDFHPLEVCCPHPPNTAGLLLEQCTQCPVEYGGENIEVVYDRHDIEQAQATGNPELSRLHDQVLSQHIGKLDGHRIDVQVEAALVQMLPSGQVQEEMIADKLHLSSRTLQRRLSEQGTSFKTLLQKTRKNLAGQYIHDNSLALSEITYLLGYSEQSNFTRAFRGWFGRTPSQYRSDLKA